MSLYRKYRPQTFEDLVGQDHISQTLRNALSAQPLRVAHAYLFVGPRGTGKTTSARLLAKCLNCEQGPTPNPCNKCDFCLRVADNQPTMDLVEIDAASHTGVDNVREVIIDKVNTAPAQGRYRVYIIDEVHMLSGSSFNALLKTLEEPPAHAIFILATTDVHKVPQTILSRCQRFDFRRVGPNDIIGRLMYVAKSENLTLQPDAARLIAQTADGALRDALTLLEQVSAFAADEIGESDVRLVLGTVSRELLLGLMDSVAQKDATSALRQVEQATEEGVSFGQLTRDLTAYCRDLLLLTVGFDDNSALSEAERARRQLHAQQIGRESLTRCVEMLRLAEKEMRQSTDHRLLLELTLVRLTSGFEYSISPQIPANAAGNAGNVGVARNANAASAISSAPQPIWKQPTIEAKPIEAKAPLLSQPNFANAPNTNVPNANDAGTRAGNSSGENGNRDPIRGGEFENDARTPLENAARFVETSPTRSSETRNAETRNVGSRNIEFSGEAVVGNFADALSADTANVILTDDARNSAPADELRDAESSTRNAKDGVETNRVESANETEIVAPDEIIGQASESSEYNAANSLQAARGENARAAEDENQHVVALEKSDVDAEEKPVVAAPSRKKGRRIHNLEELIELWPAVLARVKRKIGVTAVAYLHDAQPVAMDEQTATIEFQKEFHFEKAREAAGRLPFEDVLNECMATPHILKFRWNPPQSKAAPVEDVPPPPEDDDDDDDVVRLAQDMFGAEVVGRSGEV